jgi:hypothetical protein
MMTRATVEDFPIGCTVKVVRLPRHTWKRPGTLGAIGTVVAHFTEEGEYWVDVKFGGEPIGEVFRPWWLERGRVEWIKDEGSE